jgi:hypothetical protein
MFVPLEHRHQTWDVLEKTDYSLLCGSCSARSIHQSIITRILCHFLPPPFPPEREFEIKNTAVIAAISTVITIMAYRMFREDAKQLPMRASKNLLSYLIKDSVTCYAALIYLLFRHHENLKSKRLSAASILCSTKIRIKFTMF